MNMVARCECDVIICGYPNPHPPPLPVEACPRLIRLLLRCLQCSAVLLLPLPELLVLQQLGCLGPIRDGLDAWGRWRLGGGSPSTEHLLFLGTLPQGHQLSAISSHALTWCTLKNSINPAKSTSSFYDEKKGGITQYSSHPDISKLLSINWGDCWIGDCFSKTNPKETCKKTDE